MNNENNFVPDFKFYEQSDIIFDKRLKTPAEMFNYNTSVVLKEIILLKSIKPFIERLSFVDLERESLEAPFPQFKHVTAFVLGYIYSKLDFEKDINIKFVLNLVSELPPSIPEVSLSNALRYIRYWDKFSN